MKKLINSKKNSLQMFSWEILSLIKLTYHYHKYVVILSANWCSQLMFGSGLTFSLSDKPQYRASFYFENVMKCQEHTYVCPQKNNRFWLANYIFSCWHFFLPYWQTLQLLECPENKRGYHLNYSHCNMHCIICSAYVLSPSLPRA